VGWLLLAQTVVLLAAAAAAQYVAWGLLALGGAFPATRYAALYYSAATGGGLILLGFVLLLTPTGKLPSPRWRWWARAMVALTVALLVLVTLAPGPVDAYQQVLAGPFDFGGLDGALLVVNQLALLFTTLTVAVCAGSLVVRFRRAGGVERQQLRWVALAAALMVPAAVVALAGMALAATDVVTWAITAWLAGLPLAIGAAVLRYRLYDLDRIISRTLAYGLLTVVLGLCYVAGSLVFVLVAGAGTDPPSWLVAAATLAAAAVFRPVRRRVQDAVDRRFNRRRYDAAQTIQAFSRRLREEVNLDSLTGELLAVAEQTMQPTMASLWLRPRPPLRGDQARLRLPPSATQAAGPPRTRTGR
jgi:hypothetical protein